MLISNPQQYICAELGKKGDDVKPLDKAYVRFKDYLRFRMANVSLKADVKQEYLHTPQKILVNFEKTKFDPLMAVSSGDVAQLTPDPPLSVAHCKGFQKKQRFDVAALVTSVGTVRKVTDKREVRDVHIMDGSKFSNGKAAEIKVQFFSEKPPKIAEQEIIDLLGAAEGKPIPLPFLLFKAGREKTGIRSKIPVNFFLS